MRLAQIRIIYFKELLETLRDRRTLLMMIVFPLLFYPLLFLGMGLLLESHLAGLAEQELAVGLAGPEPPGLEGQLGEPGYKIRLTRLSAAALGPEPCQTARRLLLERQLDTIVLLDHPSCEQPGARRSEEEEEPRPPAPLGTFEILVDDANEQSTTAGQRVQRGLRRYGEEVLRQRLTAAQLDPGLVRPYGIRLVNVAGQERMGGYVASRIIPMLLLIMVIMGAFYPAIDLTAGEKERGTLETLFSAPLHPGEIIAGKYLTVVTISMISACVNLISMGLTITRAASFMSEATGALDFSLSWTSALLILALLLPTVLFFAGLTLAVAMLARDFKDAQNLMMPVATLCMLPPMLTILPGIELTLPTMLAPAFNIALLIREVLIGQATASAVLLVTLVNSVYALAALYLARRLLGAEQVLFSTQRPWRSWRAFLARGAAPDPTRLPSPGMALGLFAVLLALFYYLAIPWQARDLLWGLLATEWGLLLVPVVAFGLLGRYDLRRTFRLGRPTARGLAGSLLVAVSAWTLALAVSGLLELVFPVPEPFTQAMQAIFAQLKERLGLVGLLAVAALSPAICEEAVFRGAILAGLSRWGKWPAILLTGLLFGLFHLSLYRLLPTAVLGVLMTYVVWQTRSIWMGMLVHAATNGVVLLASYHPAFGRVLGISPEGHANWLHLAVIGALLPLGLWLLARGGGRRNEEGGRRKEE